MSTDRPLPRYRITCPQFDGYEGVIAEELPEGRVRVRIQQPDSRWPFPTHATVHRRDLVRVRPCKRNQQVDTSTMERAPW